MPSGLADRPPEVTDVDVEQVGQPPKQLVYPFGLALLGVVIFSQLIRRRRAQAVEAPAQGENG